MRYARLFIIIFIALLSSYLTRRLWPRRLTSPTLSINNIKREGPPPGIDISFEGTEGFDLLKERDGLIVRLRGEIADLSDKLITAQDRTPDTVTV